MSQKQQSTRQLGNSDRKLPLVGLGCMGMSDFYAQPDPEVSLETLRYALELGVYHWDTADMYGNGKNEELLARVLKERRQEVLLATKFGVVRGEDGAFLGVSGKPEYVRASCEASLRRLGVEQIDLYYHHRPDPTVPVEDTVGAMARLVEEGKVAHIGLSEYSAQALRQAHQVHPVSAYQGELSLWTRDHDGPGAVLEVCKELGITFVAYSPLGRGFLTGRFKSFEDLPEGDWRRNNPRFSPENFAANLKLVETVEEIAAAHGATPAQVAVAWVLSRGEKVVAIPGTTRKHRLEENVGAASLSLSSEELARLSELPAASGSRY